MQSLSRSTVSLCLRPSGYRVGSALPRWWPRAHAQRDASIMDSGSAHSGRHLDRLSRFVSTSRCNEEKQNELHSSIPLACASIKCTAKTRKKATNLMKASNEVKDNNPTAADDIWFPSVIANSSHRDGAIYKNKLFKENWFDFDITDRNETRLEPMTFLKATKRLYFPSNMLQFFSLTLAECSFSNDSLQLYGYIAVRDDRDCMLNYVLHHSRDDPVIMQKGSLIPMTGPKRGIEMVSPVLIEFDVRIKNAGQEEDDMQLIDGAIKCDERSTWRPFKHRIKGNCGAVDLSLACIMNAVEATIEVAISEVRTGFRFSLDSLIYVVEDCKVNQVFHGYKEIQLFHGTIDQSCGLRRFVLAVTWGDLMLLKFKIGQNNVEHHRSFKSKLLGSSSRLIKHELANISVKVTWSTF